MLCYASSTVKDPSTPFFLSSYFELLSMRTQVTMDDDIIKTDLLIVGAGPAGAALACFLASHGMCSPITDMLDSQD